MNVPLKKKNILAAMIGAHFIVIVDAMTAADIVLFPVIKLTTY